MPYTVSFGNALKEAVELDPSVREDRIAAVTKRRDTLMDHLMPVHVAAGAGTHTKHIPPWII